MMHEKCLKQYLLKGQGNFASRSQCEICKHPFRIVADRRCMFSCGNGIRNLKEHLTTSILFLLYSLVTIVYVAYCSHLNSKGSLNGNLQLILLIVGICLCLVMAVLALKWATTNLWVKVVVLQKVLPV